MTDPWGRADVQRQIRSELTRIGASEQMFAGLASDRPMTPTQLLAAFAATPDGAGDAAFFSALEAELER